MHVSHSCTRIASARVRQRVDVDLQALELLTCLRLHPDPAGETTERTEELILD